MKKAIIFGAFSLAGYGLCCQLLEDEVHVIGIDNIPKENSSEEERMLWIGRNALFHLVEPSPELYSTSSIVFKSADVVYYPWFGPNRLHDRGNNEHLEVTTVMEFCSNERLKLILVSSQKVANKNNLSFSADEDTVQMYKKVDLENSLDTHRMIRTQNIELLFTFIDFSNGNLEEGVTKLLEHKEWVSRKFTF
ncbi:hypothetical protein ACLM5H_01535 [Fredinandcohnia humi]